MTIKRLSITLQDRAETLEPLVVEYLSEPQVVLFDGDLEVSVQELPELLAFLGIIHDRMNVREYHRSLNDEL